MGITPIEINIAIGHEDFMTVRRIINAPLIEGSQVFLQRLQGSSFGRTILALIRGVIVALKWGDNLWVGQGVINTMLRRRNISTAHEVDNYGATGLKRQVEEGECTMREEKSGRQKNPTCILRNPKGPLKSRGKMNSWFSLREGSFMI